MDKERLRFLLKGYTENNIIKPDYDELMAYMADTANDHDLQELMQEEWNNLNEEHAFNELQKDLLFQKITADPRFEQTVTMPEKKIFHLRKWISVAAAMLVFLGTGLYVAYRIKTTSPPQELIVYQQKVVPYGKKVQIGLPDGTQVWVNSGSKLRYPSSFAGNKRELYLEGEAYFDVAHDAKRPFIIHTGKVITRVLGTAFNIKAYGSAKMSVTVARGKVSVGMPSKLLSVLTPNECLSYDRVNGNSKKYKVDASKLRWMNGDLIFENTNLEEAAVIIERWYDVQISFNNPKAKKYLFTASFLKHENIDQILDVLGEFSGYNFKREGKKITIQ